MRGATRRIVTVALLVAAAVTAGCAPLFVEGRFQTLQLFFQVSDDLPGGETREVYSMVVQESIKLRKRFVQLSGRLTLDDGTPIPLTLVVTMRHEDKKGKLRQEVRWRLDVKGNGRFEDAVKFKKDIRAGDSITLSVKPPSTAVARQSRLALCVDMVEKRNDLRLLPPCVEIENVEALEAGAPRS